MAFKITDTNHPLRKLASHLQQEVDGFRKKIPNINFGGCGVFAYESAMMLDSLGVKTTILVIEQQEDFERKKNDMLNTIDAGKPYANVNTAVNHVILLINDLGVAFDADGLHHISFSEDGRPVLWHGALIAGTYTLEELKYAAYHAQWNTWFNRLYIPEMKYYIHLIKEHYEGKIADKQQLTSLIKTRRWKRFFLFPMRFCELLFTQLN